MRDLALYIIVAAALALILIGLVYGLSLLAPAAALHRRPHGWQWRDHRMSGLIRAGA